MTNNMTREEMLQYAMEHPFKKIIHPLFSEDEYLYTEGDKRFYDENGYLFESWNISDNIHNGLRIRNSETWLDGWCVKEQED